MEEVWIGIDLGTQSVRAVGVTGEGRIAGSGSSPLQSERDGVRHQQSPDDWWRATCRACRQLFEQTGAVQVSGIAVDGTSGTVLLADGDGNPRTAGLMYDDARASHFVDEVNEAGTGLWQALGYRMQASWALPKLLWLAREQRQLLEGARLLTQVDLITWRLAGVQVASDSSNSLKTGFDPVNEGWPHRIFDQLGIPSGILPQVVRPGALIGQVGAAGSKETGVPKGTPIIAGMTDGCAAQLGAGAVKIGNWNSVLGTTLVLKGVAAHLIHDPNGVVYSHRSPDGNWLPGGASNTGARIISEKFAGRNLKQMEVAAAAREPATVISYPLIGRGERFPFTARDAEGFTLGNPENEADAFAAILQGVAFLERLSFDYLHTIGAAVDGDLTFTGGGTNSAYWTQLRADILGRVVQLPKQGEAAIGMAVLAASARQSVTEVVPRMVQMRGIIEPRLEHKSMFLDSYLQFVDALAERGWITAETVAHCRARASS